MKTIWTVLALVLLFPVSTHGALITFIHTGADSGSIGGVPFAFTPFTITAVGDTSMRGIGANCKPNVTSQQNNVLGTTVGTSKNKDPMSHDGVQSCGNSRDHWKCGHKLEKARQKREIRPGRSKCAEEFFGQRSGGAIECIRKPFARAAGCDGCHDSGRGQVSRQPLPPAIRAGILTIVKAASG
jgi:hypothetical protein